LPVLPARFLAPDWAVRAQLRPGQQVAGVGNLVMSRPISAMIPCAVARLILGISSMRSGPA
jgi:hypothetical protein